MTRPSEEIWSRMVEQAAEDVAWRQAIDEVAALSDEQLDAELRGLELDPAELGREAIALFIRPAAGARGDTGDRGELGQSLFQLPTKAAAPQRRRPVAVALWLAAAAVGTVGAGGLLYTLLHRPSEQPAPPRPSPPPPPPPVDTSLPVAAMTPAQLRALAKAALDDNRPDDCMKLLDDARRDDPAGDAAPETVKLRKRALFALTAKPGDKPPP